MPLLRDSYAPSRLAAFLLASQPRSITRDRNGHRGRVVVNLGAGREFCHSPGELLRLQEFGGHPSLTSTVYLLVRVQER